MGSREACSSDRIALVESKVQGGGHFKYSLKMKSEGKFSDTAKKQQNAQVLGSCIPVVHPSKVCSWRAMQQLLERIKTKSTQVGRRYFSRHFSRPELQIKTFPAKKKICRSQATSSPAAFLLCGVLFVLDSRTPSLWVLYVLGALCCLEMDPAVPTHVCMWRCRAALQLFSHCDFP